MVYVKHDYYVDYYYNLYGFNTSAIAGQQSDNHKNPENRGETPTTRPNTTRITENLILPPSVA